MSDDGLAPGKRLSEIRQQLGLSQRRAAELSGLTHSAISTIEQDKVSPAISTLQKLLKVYGLSLSEFFSEPEKPDEPQVVINQDDLIEMGSQGVSMKLVHNGNPNRTLARRIKVRAGDTGRQVDGHGDAKAPDNTDLPLTKAGPGDPQRSDAARAEENEQSGAKKLGHALPG